MYKDASVAVVIPAYCEEKLLPRTISRIPDYVDHIVIVDDASTDNTLKIARKHAEKDPRIHALTLPSNQGVGSAIIRGYQHALCLSAQLIAVMAADDQMDPEDLPLLLDPLLKDDADYVKGNRLAHQSWRNMPPQRRFGTEILAKLTGIIAGIPNLHDSQCGYTAISKDTLKKLPLDKIYPRYGYPNDMLLRLAENQARIAQRPVKPVYADERSDLKIHRVIVPISGILLRGALRRLSNKIA